jgi:hypothetical protein
VPSAKDAWRAVRRQRSDPPGLAGEFEDRRRVFQAALAQSEELWDAAAAAGPASRPLPLFYCLSQAGRAVCAAWSTRADWQPRSHGLGGRDAPDTPEPGERTFRYSASATSARRGAFPMLVEATRSATFAGQATVADFWVSIPNFPSLRESSRPRCLRLERVYPPRGVGQSMLERFTRRTHGVLHFSGTRGLTLEALQRTYPTTRGLRQEGAEPNLLGGPPLPVFVFPREDGSLRPLDEIGVVDTRQGASASVTYQVRPRIGSGELEPPSLFLTFWALLFCLSELARYYPDAWVAALDPDHSVEAVVLEHGIDAALDRAPGLISSALSGPLQALMREELHRLERERAEALEEGADEIDRVTDG